MWTSTLLLSFVPAPPTADSDWTSWRGPTLDGVAAADAKPPLRWSETENVRWKVELDGLGNSTPIVVGDRIYLTSAVDVERAGDDEELRPGPQPEPPNSEHVHAYFVHALQRADGKEIWRTEVTRAKPHEDQHQMGSHASPSIVLDGDNIVAFFGSRGLFGLDLEGNVTWEKQLGEMTVLEKFGEGSTPAVHGGRVVVQWDEEGPSFVAAFDTETGDEVWRREREKDSSWGSPALAVVDGKAQVILGGSDETIAYAVEDGETVWTLGGFSKNPTASILVHDGIMYAMNSYRGKIIQAVKLDGAKGALDGTEAVLWTAKEAAPYVPTAVAHDGLVYFLRDSVGVLNCSDARTGDTVYKGKRLSDLRRIHACPILAGGHLYIAGRGGTTVVVKAGREFEVVAENELDATVDATPAFVGDAIYLRSRSALYCLAAD